MIDQIEKNLVFEQHLPKQQQSCYQRDQSPVEPTTKMSDFYFRSENKRKKKVLLLIEPSDPFVLLKASPKKSFFGVIEMKKGGKKKMKK